MARSRDDDREIIYIERDDRDASSAFKPLLIGLALGLGAGLLLAPRSGEETRRLLQKRLRRLRASTGATLGDLSERIQDGVEAFRTGESPADDEADEPGEADGEEARPASSARQELERRLAVARSRRRTSAASEEPVA
ncbi:MAG: YtxH domain-containing protein [Gemmatimonadota bacterium]